MLIPDSFGWIVLGAFAAFVLAVFAIVSFAKAEAMDEDKDLTALYRRWGKIGPNEVIRREYDEPDEAEHEQGQQ